MPTTDDRRAAVLLLAVALAGLAVRFVTDRTTAPGAVAYRPASGPRPARDSLATRAAALARPLAAGERVDLDRAAADELVRLPRIGPGLAARIVADREARGPFGSLAALGRVSGIGPTTLDGLRPYATFSAGAGRGAALDDRAEAPVRLNDASAAELAMLPGIGPRLAEAIVADRARRGPYRTLADLARVRGIGPAALKRLEGRILVP